MKSDLKKRLIIKLLNDSSIENLSLKQLNEYIFNSPQKASVTQQWSQSNCTDFTAYSNPDYQWDLVDCFLAVSESSTQHVLRYLQKNGYNWQSLSYFDDWNGNGLTTIDLLAAGCQDISFFNDVSFQAQSLIDMAKDENFVSPKHVTTRQQLLENQYDVVLSLQCVEHFERPLDYVDELMKIVKVGGLLCLSVDGFSWTPNQSIGHFWTYFDKDNKPHTGRQIRPIVKKYLKDNGFELIPKACWNANPHVFKRIK